MEKMETVENVSGQLLQALKVVLFTGYDKNRPITRTVEQSATSICWSWYCQSWYCSFQPFFVRVLQCMKTAVPIGMRNQRFRHMSFRSTCIFFILSSRSFVLSFHSFFLGNTESMPRMPTGQQSFFLTETAVDYQV